MPQARRPTVANPTWCGSTIASVCCWCGAPAFTTQGLAPLRPNLQSQLQRTRFSKKVKADLGTMGSTTTRKLSREGTGAARQSGAPNPLALTVGRTGSHLNGKHITHLFSLSPNLSLLTVPCTIRNRSGGRGRRDIIGKQSTGAP